MDPEHLAVPKTKRVYTHTNHNPAQTTIMTTKYKQTNIKKKTSHGSYENDTEAKQNMFPMGKAGIILAINQ